MSDLPFYLRHSARIYRMGRLVSVLKRQKGASVLLCFCDNGFATKTDTGEGASDSSCIESQQE